MVALDSFPEECWRQGLFVWDSLPEKNVEVEIGCAGFVNRENIGDRNWLCLSHCRENVGDRNWLY